MLTTKRLDLTIKKLYIAFHSNNLNPECCKQCVVGNILDNTDSWKYFSDDHGSIQLNYVGKINELFGRKFNGYSPQKLLQIEASFLKPCGFKLPIHHKNKMPKNPIDKDILFEGLTAVVSLLCKLDGVRNVMNYTKLFEFENNKPRFTLSEILI